MILYPPSPQKKKQKVRAWNPSGTREVGGSTVALLRGESAKLKAQLMASMEKEAALSRVLKDQAAELLGGVTTYPQ